MRSLTKALLLALVIVSPFAMASAQNSSAVIPGVEVLLTDSMHLIRGKRVGLLTNHSGRDRHGTSTIDLLFKAPGVKLTALFGPEHGIRGVAKAGEKVSSTVDSATGVPIYSLYGETRVPTPEMMKDVDVIVYDIQDVGARVYTFEWTLALTAVQDGTGEILERRSEEARHHPRSSRSDSCRSVGREHPRSEVRVACWPVPGGAAIRADTR